MSYKIQYTTISPEKHVSVKKGVLRKYRKKMIGLVVLVLCAFIGKELLFDHLQDPDLSATDAAVDIMIQSIINGDGLYEALSTFCLEVIENGR